MQNVDNSPYPRKQSKRNEFIPCLNDVCHNLNVSTALKLKLSPVACLNHRINSVLLGRIAAARKVDSGRDRRVIAIITSSMTFLSPYTSQWWRQTLNTFLYFTVISQSEASRSWIVNSNKWVKLWSVLVNESEWMVIEILQKVTGKKENRLYQRHVIHIS